jgi:hypothetical protein
MPNLCTTLRSQRILGFVYRITQACSGSFYHREKKFDLVAWLVAVHGRMGA